MKGFTLSYYIGKKGVTDANMDVFSRGMLTIFRGQELTSFCTTAIVFCSLLQITFIATCIIKLKDTVQFLVVSIIN